MLQQCSALVSHLQMRQFTTTSRNAVAIICSSHLRTALSVPSFLAFFFSLLLSPAKYASFGVTCNNIQEATWHPCSACPARSVVCWFVGSLVLHCLVSIRCLFDRALSIHHLEQVVELWRSQYCLDITFGLSSDSDKCEPVGCRPLDGPNKF